MNATVLYDLPFGHGRQYSLSGIADRLAGGWQAGGIVNFRSGVPIDVLITRPDVAYVGNAGTAIAGQTFSSPVVTAGVVQTTAVANVPGGGNASLIRRGIPIRARDLAWTPSLMRRRPHFGRRLPQPWTRPELTP